MKYSIILAFMAVCNASLFRFQSYGVRREIRIHGERRIFINAAKKIVIFNVPKEDPTILEITIKDQSRNVTVIKLNNDKQIIERISTSPSVSRLFDDEETGLAKNNDQTPGNAQMKILVKIFRKHEGLAGEASLYELLREIKYYVERHELAPIIYEVLSDLQDKPLAQNELRTGNIDEEQSTAEEISTRRNIELYNLEDQTVSLDRKRYKGTIHQDRQERRIDELQSPMQTQWIQNLLKTRLKQLPSDLSNKLEKDLKQLLLQTSIQELERDIQREQLNADLLHNQHRFLTEQKGKLKLHLNIAQKQNLNGPKMLQLRQSYDQLKRQEEILLEELLNIHKTIHKLQGNLIKKEQELKDDLKKEFESDLRY